MSSTSVTLTQQLRSCSRTAVHICVPFRSQHLSPDHKLPPWCWHRAPLSDGEAWPLQCGLELRLDLHGVLQRLRKERAGCSSRRQCLPPPSWKALPAALRSGWVRSGSAAAPSPRSGHHCCWSWCCKQACNT